MGVQVPPFLPINVVINHFTKAEEASKHLFGLLNQMLEEKQHHH